MREIKFRLWDTKEKIMLNIGLVDFPRQTIHNARSDDRLVSKSYVKDPNGYGERWGAFKDVVIEQYTGLKDKNGKKIFEGDIVKTHFSFDHNVEQEPFIITWNKDKAMFEGVKPEKNKDDYLRRFSFFPEQEFIYEIIGNVHENPELVED